MSEKLKIDDWLDDEQDALTDELSAAFAPRRAEADSFGAAVREQIREAEAVAPAPASASDGRLGSYLPCCSRRERPRRPSARARR